MLIQKPIKPVFIVGAGPGDPELLTLKAVRLLRQAGAVIYDRLISDEILAFINPAAKRYFAGKSCKQHSMTQDEINHLMVTLARQGVQVVRLKGGDPLIFGRGGEEASYLAEHDILFELVSGISAASGCSSYYNIPLTYRGMATGVRYVTGHCKAEELSLNWQSLADPYTTLVIYMGLANLSLIATRLMEHGMPPLLPVALIENGTTPQGRIVISDLKHCAKAAQQHQLVPPTLIIMGRVVSLDGIGDINQKNQSRSPVQYDTSRQKV